MYQGGLTRYNITRVLGCGGQLFLLADAVYIHNA